MTQVEISWELCSIEATVSRIKEITNAERDLLLGLVRIYYRARQLGNGYHDNGDGRVLHEPSKRELAKAIGVGLATVKRRLRDLRDLPDGSRYISVGESSWRTHCYEIDFSAIYSADLFENDPGSGGSFRGITRGIRGITQGGQGDQGDHDSKSSQRLRFQGSDDVSRGITQGDQGDQKTYHTIEPYHKAHSGEPEIQKPINHGTDGPLKRFGFIDVRKSEFRDPVAIQKRFEEVVAAGLLNSGEVDRQAFFALMINLERSKGLDHPAKQLTNLVRGGKDPWGNTLRTRSKIRDHDKASKWIKQLDKDEREKLATAPRTDAHPLDEWGDDWVDETPIDDDAAEPDSVPVANDLPDEVVRELPAEVADQIREFQERKRKELANHEH